jgi:hypothetical protein
MSKKGGVVILPKLTESSLQNKGRYALLPLPLPPISRTQEYSEPLLEVRNDHTPLPPIHSKQGVRAIPAVSIEAAESSEPLLAIGNDNTPLPPISRTADSIKADEPSEPLLESENDYTLLQKEVTSLINNSEEELLKLKKKQNAYKKALDRANAIATEEKLQSMIDRIDNIIPIETKYLEELNKINNDIKSLLETTSIKSDKHDLEERLRALITQTDSDYDTFYNTYIAQGEEQ